jgi:hypothetical protein
VYQDTSATETASIKVVTGAAQLVGAGDGDEWLTIEFNASAVDADNGFRYITVVPTGPAGGDDYACMFLLGFKARELPVSKPANYSYHVSVV